MKILNFGSCNIDYVYRLSHIVVPGETLSASSREVFPGGKGLNQSVAAARAGARVYHAGVLGQDGAMLREVLEHSGVDTRYLTTDPSPNGHAVIQVGDNAQNSIFLFEGTNGMVTREGIDRVLADFGPGDVLLLQNEISNVPYLISRGHEKGMTVVFNPAPFAPGLRELDLGQVDHMILNEVEAEGFFGSQDPQLISLAARAWPGLQLVVTLGKQGCVYICGEQLHRCPAFRVEAVDTTAAGDTFTGYFVAALAEGRDILSALRRCCAASALAVSKMGAAPSIPTRDEVDLAVKTLTPNSPGQPPVEEQLRAWLGQNLSCARLEALADHLGYSPSYTGALVKKYTGLSYTDLLQQLRCEEAARLLRQTQLPVGSIIQQVGYHNESFFRREFREKWGLSPLQYRKKLLGGKKNDR